MGTLLNNNLILLTITYIIKYKTFYVYCIQSDFFYNKPAAMCLGEYINHICEIYYYRKLFV